MSVIGSIPKYNIGLPEIWRNSEILEHKREITLSTPNLPLQLQGRYVGRCNKGRKRRRGKADKLTLETVVEEQVRLS